jgi:hypothetical protein
MARLNGDAVDDTYDQDRGKRGVQNRAERHNQVLLWSG